MFSGKISEEGISQYFFQSLQNIGAFEKYLLYIIKHFCSNPPKVYDCVPTFNNVDLHLFHLFPHLSENLLLESLQISSTCGTTASTVYCHRLTSVGETTLV